MTGLNTGVLHNPNPAFWGGKRVLLTGHTGFKGSWLAFWLLELGAEVTGLALPPNTEPNLFSKLQLDRRLDHRLGDIRDPQAVANLVAEICPQVVFHLAAQPLVRKSYKDPMGTWATNVMGTINMMEALRPMQHPCTAVLITTDKVYRNHEWLYGYRESDPLGGHDPYSSSKAAAELAIDSWRSSYCGDSSHQTPNLRLASARAGNVIGGGDWAADRIMPDLVRALGEGQPIGLRNPMATRPWQHVLEPIGGYLILAEALASSEQHATSFNFGPQLQANRSVKKLVEEALLHWPGSWEDLSRSDTPLEASLLNLVVDKAFHQLGWAPRWTFATSVERTLNWYRRVQENDTFAYQCCQDDLAAYLSHS